MLKLTEEELAKFERDADFVIADKSRLFHAVTFDAARSVKSLCKHIRSLQAQILECRAVRDSWCSAYTELRDNPASKSN
jgi:hypothetical protein